MGVSPISKNYARLNALLQRVQAGDPISAQARELLLRLEAPDDLEALFNAARHVRERHFGNQVFLYGFLYTTTHCRNRCRFCLYRSGNSAAPRYRKKREEIISLSLSLASSGVHLIDLTMGEDPAHYRKGEEGFENLFSTLSGVANATGLPVMISPGVVPLPVLERFAQLGAGWYACYQETHNPDLYARLRVRQDYENRMQVKREAKAQGMLIEEGVLTGVGETYADLLHSISMMQQMKADQVRVMTFVPQRGTPLAFHTPPSPLLELKLIALMRLCMPDRLIPASLDIDGLAGLERRLMAGANVVTSIVPPGQGLAGVAQSELDIEDGGRSVAGVKQVLIKCDLTPAAPEQYREWMNRRRSAMRVELLRPRRQSGALY